MNARLLRAVIAAAALASLVLSGPGAAVAAAPACAGGATSGCWSAPFSPFGEFDAAPPQTPAESMKYPAAASSVVLPNGRVLYWNGLQNLEDSNATLALDAGRTAANSKTRLLDLSGTSPAFMLPNPEQPGGDDMFCADQRLLADGRVIVAGGTHWSTDQDIPDEITGPNGPDGGAELYGSKNTHMYSASAPTNWSLSNDMNFGRWYPSMLTLSDGKQFIAGGVEKLLYNSNVLGPTRSALPENVAETETFDPATGVWTDNGPTAKQDLPLYARLHLLPNGNVFYTGAGQMWSPSGASIHQAEWNDQRVYDPAAKTWSTVGSLTLGARSGAFSVMLPLKAPYDTAEILIGGGNLGTSPGTYVANNLSEKITVGASGPSTTMTSPMVNNRWYSSAVGLPNGEVVAFNGATADEVIMPGLEKAVRQAELWNGSAWVPLSSGSRDRTYHNSAILLADGSVLVGGHAPINNFYGGQGQNSTDSPSGTNNLKDPSFERFYPPYLYGAKPALVSTTASVTWGGSLDISWDNGQAAVAKVVLSRLPAATHTTDADARSVELGAPTGVSTAGSVTSGSVTLPSSGAVLPPGYYYAFGLSADGTPGTATIVQVTASATGGTATPVAIN